MLLCASLLSLLLMPCIANAADCCAGHVQIQGLPTMIFIGTNDSKPALRTEGLLTAEVIKGIISKEL
jgi:hypothetical protein